MEKILFVCGKFIEKIENGAAWELAGIFEEENDCVNACIDRNHFVGPVELNKVLPDATTIWPGVYYPIADKEKEK